MKKRQELGMRQGMMLPIFRLRDDLELEEREFVILSYGKELYPGVADGLVPERIGYGELLRVLKAKLKKGENIRDLIHILEELETAL